MRERHSHELPRWMKLLGAWRINSESIDFKWGYFAPRAGFEFVINRGTYFDQRYAIGVAFGWGKFMIYLPFKTKLKEGSDMPRYGFAIHNETFWLYKGGNYDESIGQVQDRSSLWAWCLPYFNYEFDGHWIKDKHKTWVKMGEENIGNQIGMSAWDFRKMLAYTESHHYTYTLKNGTIQNRIATCTIEKREWHRKWFPWLTMTKEIIDVEFDKEVGERSGTWKGGVLGCSYDLQPNDTIESCLRRMEQERVM